MKQQGNCNVFYSYYNAFLFHVLVLAIIIFKSREKTGLNQKKSYSGVIAVLAQLKGLPYEPDW